MPEAPELHLAALFVNRVCKDRLFKGPVRKSAVSTRNPDIPWNEEAYRISAASRGKEVKLFLTADNKKGAKAEPRKMTILINFGISGKFQFTNSNDLDKHAHLMFAASEGDMVLSFVDQRRFGRWEVTESWGKDRGPCVITEYEAFRENVLNNMHRAVFNKPICEVMLDQKYFHGIGNYLRSEILFRLSIRPFDAARPILEQLVAADKKTGKKATGSPKEDFLETCHKVAQESVDFSLNLGRSMYESNKEEGMDNNSDFMKWLRCYYQPESVNLVDHNGRTIWFQGDPGPLVPDELVSRERVKQTKMLNKSAAEDKSNEGQPPVKKIKESTEDTPMEEGRPTRSAKDGKKATKSASKSASRRGKKK